MILGKHIIENRGYTNWNFRTYMQIELGTKVSSVLYLQTARISINSLVVNRLNVRGLTWN